MLENLPEVWRNTTTADGQQDGGENAIQSEYKLEILSWKEKEKRKAENIKQGKGGKVLK